MIRVLFVCMGNICRSPMAEAVFRHLVAEAGLADQIEVDSAGTLEYHVGARPHRGTQRVLAARGIALRDHCAGQVRPSDLDDFDYVIAMDSENIADLRLLTRRKDVEVRRLLDFAPDQPLRDVPDPYYTGNFEAVYDLIYRAARGLLEHIRHERGLSRTMDDGP